MPKEPATAEIMKLIRELRDEVARLGERISALEAGAIAKSHVAAPRATSVAAAPSIPSGLSDEIVLVLGAAIAGYLGKKAHIRQIRLVGSAAWAQQGRVTIQASHGLPSAS